MRWVSVMRLARLVRSNVDRQLSQNGRRSETGAVVSLIAILFGTGVLLGLGAIVIDTGSLLYERRQVQNGADAVALAAAKDCAANAACTPNSVAGLAVLTALAGSSASSDGKTGIESSICGNAIARTTIAGLVACPALTGQLVDCPPVPAAFALAPYIEVRTKTLNADGTSILPPILARSLAGGGGYSGETVRACSRAAWVPAGPPQGPVLPVTFSYCQWQVATGADPSHAIPGHFELPPAPNLTPGYGSSLPDTPWPAIESVLFTQSPQHPPVSCNTWNSHVAPGTFGELSEASCGALVSTDNWVQATNGNPAPCDLAVLDGLIGHTVNVPIFDCYTPNVFNWAAPPVPAPTCNDNHPASWYHVSGFASFYLTGFNFSGNAAMGKSIFPPDHGTQPCNGSDRCISGWFTTGVLSATPSTDGTFSFGSSIIQLAG